MLKNEIVQLKSYDENTGQEIGNVLPITNSEAVKVENDKNLKQTLVDMNDKIEQTNASLDFCAKQVDLEVERARIDLLTKIEIGQTEGNSELLDIRIGADGKTYGSAGEAVREQVKMGKTQAEIIAQNLGYEVKNILPPFDSIVQNGITWIVDKNGVVTLNGTATNAGVQHRQLTLKKGKYILNGCPADGTTVGCYYTVIVGGKTYYLGDDSESFTITISHDDTILDIYISIRQGSVVSNKVFKPMLRLKEFTDTSYVPYGYMTYKSNKEKEVEDKSDTIYIGAGQQFTTVVSGFAYALQNDKEVVIMPGVYDLYAEGVKSGVGLFLPRKVVGYGAKLVLNLPNENWTTSPLNVLSTSTSTWAEGFEVECSNCRYCIHDEMYKNPNYYHNVFKNLKLTNNGVKSDVLIRPIAIGGGVGNKGLIEIIDCECSSNDDTQDVNYHSNSLGQTDDCIVKCTGSIFKNGIGCTENSKAGFTNEMHVNNCLSGKPIESKKITNFTLKAWNNEVIS